MPLGGSGTLTFEFPGLALGVAERDEGPTGATVFYFPDRAYGVVDTRGGAPGSSLTEVLKSSFGKYIDAVVFAGGSVYGLEAASGVAAALFESGEASRRWGEIAVVPGAVVFDFKGRDTNVYPNRELGIEALRNCREGLFPLGARGAGRFVHCGSYFGEEFMERTGQGAAFGRHGSARVAVFTVVNARGVIIDRAGQIVRGNRDPGSGQRASIQERIVARRHETASGTAPPGLTDNTTLTLVVTDLALNREQLERLGIETHSSMARAIQPFHTVRDGDTLFAISTGDCVADTPNPADLSVIASELAWDAVLSCLPCEADLASTDSGPSAGPE
jgi:L-aminopeptidase/D-esterase-like protein